MCVLTVECVNFGQPRQTIVQKTEDFRCPIEMKIHAAKTLCSGGVQAFFFCFGGKKWRLLASFRVGIIGHNFTRHLITNFGSPAGCVWRGMTNKVRP